MKLFEKIKRGILIALGVLLASNTSSGISYDSASVLVFAVVLLTLCNVFFKPLLMFFSLPFIILTLGIGIWFINALLLLLVGGLVEGFHVASFGSALWGALVVSLTNGIGNLFFGAKKTYVEVNGSRTQQPAAGGTSGSQQTRRPLKDDDVIDI